MNDPQTQIILDRINETRADLKQDIQGIHDRITRHAEHWNGGLDQINGRVGIVEKQVSAHDEALSGLKKFRDGFWGRALGLLTLIAGIAIGVAGFIWR